MCVILSATPDLNAAAPESPPPIIVVASKSASTLAIAFVPIANFSNSDTPTGPFHITVFAPCNSFEYSSIVFSPISIPSQSAGILSNGTTFTSVSGAYSFPTLTSSGRSIFTPFCFAFSINSKAKSHLSGSQSDIPTSYPCALKNVYDIPPPMNSVSTLSNKASITPILSDTFAPPTIAINGLTGLSIVFFKKSISFSIKNPATAGKYDATPVVDACALCAEPNASFTNISHPAASSFANSESLSVSSL